MAHSLALSAQQHPAGRGYSVRAGVIDPPRKPLRMLYTIGMLAAALGYFVGLAVGIWIGKGMNDDWY
jgi:hypothetical protein